MGANGISSRFIQHLTKSLKVLPRQTRRLRTAQEIRGVVRHDERRAAVRVNPTAQPPYAFFALQQRLRRKFAHGKQRARLYRIDLSEEKIRALLHLIRQRIAVIRWPAFECVANIHAFARKARGQKQQVEKSAGLTNKRTSSSIFLLPRRLAHHHHVSVRVPFAEHDIRTSFVEAAARASASLFLQNGQAAGRDGDGRARCLRVRGSLWSGLRARGPRLHQERECCVGGERVEVDLALAGSRELLQVAQQQSAVHLGILGGHLGARRGINRSRICSATSSLDWSGRISGSASGAMIVTRLVSTSNPAPASRASFNTMRSRDFSRSFFRALSTCWSVSRAKPTTRSCGPRAESVSFRTSGAGSSASAPVP